MSDDEMNTPEPDYAPDGYCFDCGETFRLDDTGGYNPPCPCGCGLCRSCHNALGTELEEWNEANELADDEPEGGA